MTARPFPVRLAALALLILCRTSSMQAQLPPIGPLSPERPEQCQAFGAEVDRYAELISKEHEECLAAHKADRLERPDNSASCSRSACQNLHNNLYGNGVLSVKTSRREVSECNRHVNEYLKHKAAEEKQEAERRDAARKKDEERAVQEQRDPDQRKQYEKQTRDRQSTLKKKEQQQRALPAQGAAAPVNTEQPPSASTNPASSSSRSVQVQDTEEQYEARMKAREEEKKKRSEDALLEIADPFDRTSKKASVTKRDATSAGIVDPFSSENRKSASTPEKIPADREDDQAFDKAKDLFKQNLDSARDKLDENLATARLKLSPSDFRRYERDVQKAKNYMRGLSFTVTAAKYSTDAKAFVANPANGWHDIVKDGAQDGFEYVLKHVAPRLAEVYEGPVGWLASITLDSSSTQTPTQDFDPMSVINDPDNFSFEQRLSALQKLYESEGRHPEVWNNSKRRWLYRLTEQVYNAPDNPNIRLTPR